jgi:hypothetical protein
MDPRHHFCWVFLLITKADFMPSKLRDECILFKTKYLYFIVSEISLLKELDSVLNILIFPYLLVLEIHTGIWKEENVQPASVYAQYLMERQVTAIGNSASFSN